MLPKILHLFWGRDRPLSFFRYLTAASFHKHHPDWQIMVWTPSTQPTAPTWATNEQRQVYNGRDYINEFGDCVHVVDFSDICGTNSIPAVHQSDLLRWYVLGSYGGVWSDFDVLYCKPLPDWILTQPGAGLCSYRAVPSHPFNYLAIGFHTSAGDTGKQFFSDLFEAGKSRIPQTRYQAFGAELLKSFLQSRGTGETYEIPPVMVYPYFTHTNIRKYWTPEPLPCMPSTIGYHWYAGMPESGRYQAEITPDNLADKCHQWAICRPAMEAMK